MNILTDKDCDVSIIRTKRIAVIGYGAQGRAHVLNLRDSGCNVVVGLREGSPSFEKVRNDGVNAERISDAVQNADIVMILVPDEHHDEVYKQYLKTHLKAGSALGFAHGFSVHFDFINPRNDIDVFMVAPKAAGYAVRALYEAGGGAMAMMAVAKDVSGQARALAMAYASAIGCGRSGILETTFGEECEADLFGEQAVLCGGLTALLKAGFETLVANGFAPEVAYIETVHEAKIIMDLIHEKGLAQMRTMISNTAEYGDYTRGDRIINETSRNAMQSVLNEIQNGSFPKEFLGGNKEGLSNLIKYRKDNAAGDIEDAGRIVRKMAGLS